MKVGHAKFKIHIVSINGISQLEDAELNSEEESLLLEINHTNVVITNKQGK